MPANTLARAATRPALLTLCMLAPAAPAWAVTDQFTLTVADQGLFGPAGGVGGGVGFGLGFGADPMFNVGDGALGFGASISANANVGLTLSAGTSGGTASLALPVTATLSASANYLNGSPFTVSAGGGLAVGSFVLPPPANSPTFAVSNPGLQASLSGDASVSAGASAHFCIAGDCSSASTGLVSAGASGQIVGVDTTKPNPLTIVGKNVPVPYFHYNTPTPILAGPLPIGVLTAYSPTGATGGRALTSSTAIFVTSQKVLDVTVDAAGALGLPNGTLSASIGPVSASLTPIEVLPTASLSVTEALAASAPIDEILTFSKPVTEVIAGKTVTGTTVTLGVSDPSLPSSAKLSWAGAPGQLVSRQYVANAPTLTTTVTAPITLSVPITVLKGSLGLSVAGTSVGTNICLLCVDPTKTYDPVIGTSTIPLSLAAPKEAFGPIASAALSASSVTLAARVGQTAPTAFVGVKNIAGPGSDSLQYRAAPSAPPFLFSGSGQLAPGTGDAEGITARLVTSRAGAFTQNSAVQLATDGSQSGLGASSLPSAPVALKGDVYAAAVAQVAPEAKFGIVHVGQSVTPLAVGVRNIANGALADQLVATWAGPAPAPFGASGSVSGLKAGSSSNALQVSLDTGKAGVFSGRAALALTSHDAELSDLALRSTSVLLDAQVNNYARAAFTLGGPGVLTVSGDAYTLNLGRLYAGYGVRTSLDLANVAAGPADALGGSYLRGAQTTNGLLDLSGDSPFAGLAAGGGSLSLGLDLTGLAAGAFSDRIVLDDYGTNDSGYKGALDPLTIDVIADFAVPEPRAAGVLGLALTALFASRARLRPARPRS